MNFIFYNDRCNFLETMDCVREESLENLDIKILTHVFKNFKYVNLGCKVSFENLFLSFIKTIVLVRFYAEFLKLFF
jgi:hypothetical protein